MRDAFAEERGGGQCSHNRGTPPSRIGGAFDAARRDVRLGATAGVAEGSRERIRTERRILKVERAPWVPRAPDAGVFSATGE